MAKKVNVELNMTPFIGLFALLVVMLLLTAVWNKLGALSTNSAGSTASESPPSEKQVSLNVTILDKHVEMSEDSKGINIPHLKGNVIDTQKIIETLGMWKIKYPKRSDVILNTENSVTYNQLITVFDTLVGNKWEDVGVNTQ